MAESSLLFGSGFVLVIIGIIMVMLAILLISNRSAKKGKIRGTGAVIIGPIPIVFGNDRRLLKTVLLLSIVLSVLLIVVTVLQYLLLR